MSKSLGNVVAPQDLIQKYGADIVRLWVASLDYRDDDPISEEILARCGEAYRKIRNTARYLLSNLYDFDPAGTPSAPGDLLPLDRWALAEARTVVAAGPRRLRDLRVPRHLPLSSSTFCATTLSAFYCDILKDRLYASARGLAGAPVGADGPPPDRPRPGGGRGAPVLPFTAEEIWAALPGKEGRIGPPGAFRRRWTTCR